MSAYYNEFDKQKAAVLRELIREGVIAPGDVDERSIKDVRAADLVGYRQCHFFAGIGVWSYAARCAGWPDDRPIWTASTPCPSFSSAGKGEGFDDPRHLWPEVDRLVGECRPAVLFGEQADAAVRHGWLDLVCADLEEKGYAVAPQILGAHSVGAPHIRQRIYFVAHADALGDGWRARRDDDGRDERQQPAAEGGAGDQRLYFDADSGACTQSGWVRDKWGQEKLPAGAHTVAYAAGTRLKTERGSTLFRGIDVRSGGTPIREWLGPGWLDPHTARSVAEAGATRGFWGDCDWWLGRAEPGYPEGRYRPAQSGIQPLAHGAAARVLKLRCFGDAIVAPLAEAFIKSYMEIMGMKTLEGISVG